MSTLTAVYSFIKPAQGQSPWDANINGDLDSVDAELARPRWPFNSPTVGATTTCDLSLARLFLFTVSQATTVAFTNPPSSSFGTRVVLRITNGNAFVLTWPASVVWLSGVAPILKSSGVDVVELWSTDAGTTWYAAALDRPLNRLVGQVTTDSGTGANTAEVTLHTIAIPANILGPNGALRVRVHYSVTGANSTKQLNVYYGATQLANAAFAAGDQTANGQMDLVMVNRNATNAQHFGYSYLKNLGPPEVFVHINATGAEDSTGAKNLLVKGLTPNAADEVTANMTFVELLRA